MVKKGTIPAAVFCIAVMASAILVPVISYAIPGETMHTIELPQTRVEFKPGAGMETTERYCGICHSLDYITMQPQFSRAKWNAIVNKMIKVMGAPIPDEDAKVIADYLAAQYGTGQ
jgi:mono/diheme cytochrome c family protein